MTLFLDVLLFNQAFHRLSWNGNADTSLNRLSSFRWYALRENGVVEIESQWTARDRGVKTTGGPARIFVRPG